MILKPILPTLMQKSSKEDFCQQILSFPCPFFTQGFMTAFGLQNIMYRYHLVIARFPMYSKSNSCLYIRNT